MPFERRTGKELVVAHFAGLLETRRKHRVERGLFEPVRRANLFGGRAVKRGNVLRIGIRPRAETAALVAERPFARLHFLVGANHCVDCLRELQHRPRRGIGLLVGDSDGVCGFELLVGDHPRLADFRVALQRHVRVFERVFVRRNVRAFGHGVERRVAVRVHGDFKGLAANLFDLFQERIERRFRVGYQTELLEIAHFVDFDICSILLSHF